LIGAVGYEGESPLHRANGQTCETMKLKMGALAGQKLFNHKDGQRERDKVIDDLNTGNLNGIVMTDRVGGCGHNLVGTSHMIFMGSLYSQAYEDQCVGNWIIMMTINGSSHLQTWTDSDSSYVDDCGPKLCQQLYPYQYEAVKGGGGGDVAQEDI
jgi:hypothetical protein